MKTSSSPTFFRAILALFLVLFYPIQCFRWVRRCCDLGRIEGVGFLSLGVIGAVMIAIMALSASMPSTADGAHGLRYAVCGLALFIYILIGYFAFNLMNSLKEEGVQLSEQSPQIAGQAKSF
ncbi:MAG: hypothetical protein WCV82_01325 [Candidatus Paceibacterota bacterium]